MRIAPTLLAALALTLTGLTVTGCNRSNKAEGAGTAAGEILPGSTSDAMIPLDSVRSQAPLAPQAESADKPKAKATAMPAAAAEAPAEAAPAEPAAAEE